MLLLHFLAFMFTIAALTLYRMTQSAIKYIFIERYIKGAKFAFLDEYRFSHCCQITSTL